MTSRSSKNRQTILPSTPRWKRLKVTLLGASLLVNLSPVAPAEVTGGAESLPGTTRPAVERWKRLKSQYELSPVPATRSPRNPIPETGPAHSAATESIPASDTVVPVRPAPEPAVVEAEPEWTLADSPATDEPQEVGRTAEEILSTPEDTNPPAVPETAPATAAQPATELPKAAPPKAVPPGAVSEAAPPAEATPRYEDKEDVKSPADTTPLRRGVPRPLTPQIPSGPPRKTTQIRRMSDIAPLADFNRDTEIKRYAAERAREFNVRFGDEPYAPRSFPDVAMPWEAPHSKYFPLYFEDPALERYGHSYHPLLQPVVSSARVSAQLVMMPYQMTINPPCEVRSPLGWYRPGEVTPKLRYPFPWNAKAAAVEAAAITGFIYLIP